MSLFFFRRLLFVICLVIRVFKLKIASNTRHNIFSTRCSVVAALLVQKHTHIYIYISNARFRFSFAIERERLTVTRRGRRRKYASRNVRENAPGLSDV